jgi:hypothetical protein
LPDDIAGSGIPELAHIRLMLSAVAQEWTDLKYPPPRGKLVWLRREDGSQVIGWRVYDSMLGKSFFWGWTDDAAKPSRYDSRWSRAGVTPIKPVSWRPYTPDRVVVPSDPIARRESEILVHRAILTDGTMRGLRRGGLESSWDDAWHTDEKERGAGELIDYEHVNKVRFQPTPKDVQNYEDGIVLSWYLALRKTGHWLGHKGLSEAQHLMVWKAYGYALAFAGDRIRVTESYARRLYRSAVDAVWDAALRETRPVRRLRKEDWSKEA